MVNATSGSLVIKERDYAFVPKELELEFQRLAMIFSYQFMFAADKRMRNMTVSEVGEEVGPWAYSIAFLYPDEINNLLADDDHDPLVYAINIFYENVKTNPELYGLKPHVEYHPAVLDDAAESIFFENAREYIDDCAGGEEAYELNWFGFLADLMDFLVENRIVHLVTVDGKMEDFESFLFPQKEVW